MLLKLILILNVLMKIVYKIAKEKYYATKQAEKLIVGKRLMK